MLRTPHKQIRIYVRVFNARRYNLVHVSLTAVSLRDTQQVTVDSFTLGLSNTLQSKLESLRTWSREQLWLAGLNLAVWVGSSVLETPCSLTY